MVKNHVHLYSCTDPLLLGPLVDLASAEPAGGGAGCHPHLVGTKLPPKEAVFPSFEYKVVKAKILNL